MTVAVTIAASGNNSTAIDVDPERPIVGLWFPAAWTATAVRLQASRDGGTTWATITELGSGTVFEAVGIEASEYVPLDPLLTVGARLVRLVSVTAQDAQRLVYVSRRTFA